MDVKKYEGLVQLVKSTDFFPPDALIIDYDNPTNRVMTARLLLRLKKYSETLELLHTVSKDDLEDLEQWIWVLNDIGRCHYYSADLEKALAYFTEAEKLVSDPLLELTFLTRGEVWGNTLQMLHELGRLDGVQKEIISKIDYFKSNPNSYKSNSYLFYAYFFQALHQENASMAQQSLKTALDYYPNQELQSNFEDAVGNWEENSKALFDKILNTIKLEKAWNI